MSNSRNNQTNSSDDNAPDSRKNKANPDPLYYHPNAHPTPSIFFNIKKREELDKRLSASSDENISETKATL
jgi:hypothetical protein